MITRITQLLIERKGSNAPAELQKVPQMAKRLEKSLFRNAASFEEYSDTSTLKLRLQAHLLDLLPPRPSLTCPISTGLLVQPMKARPCGHVYSAASAWAYFDVPSGKKCAVFGCNKVLNWSDFVEDKASEIALRATTQGHVPHQPVSDPHQSLAAPATTQGHAPDLSSYEDAMATQRRFRQDLLQRMREREQWRRDVDRMSNPHQSLAAPATTQGHVANSLDRALATERRFQQDLLQRLREGAQFRQLIGQMQREGVQQAAASRQRQLAWLGL